MLATLLPVDLAVRPAAHDPGPAPQRRRRHRRRRSRRYPVGQFLPAWSPDEAPALPAEQSQWAAVRRIVEQADPRRIGIDVSESFALADGLVAHRAPAAHRGARAPTPTASSRPRTSPSAGWRPGCPRRSRPCTRSTGWRTRSSPRPSPPPSSPPGRRRRSTSPGGSASASTTSGVEPWFQPTRRAAAGRRPAGRGARHAAARRPLRRGHRARRPGALRRRADQPGPAHRHPAQRLRAAARRDEPRRTGLAAALRAGNRMQDLTTAALIAGRTGNEVLAAARAAAAAEGIDADVYSHPVGFHGHGAGPAIGQWDEQGGVPGRGRLPGAPRHRLRPGARGARAGAGVGRAVRADGAGAGHRAHRRRRASTSTAGRPS